MPADKTFPSAWWSDPSTRVCAVLEPGLALANKGATLQLPCLDASGARFNASSKYLVGFAINDTGTKAVPRWADLSWVVGPP